jgi:hypothetical protein
MSFLFKTSQRSDNKRTFKGPVGWLLGQQSLAGLKWIAIYTAYGDKLNFCDWMQGYAGEEPAPAPQSGAQEFWFDYIADTGDGQRATYSIAYLCHSDVYLPTADCVPGPNQVSLTDGAFRLPRGQFLFVGGDTAYHIADLETLAERFCEPFNWAYDDCFGPAIKPEHVRSIYAIPANHDYYDFLDGFNRIGRNPKALDHITVEDSYATAGDSTHGQFLIPRHTKFAHNQHVQRDIEGAGDFIAHGNSATRERKNHGVRVVGILGKFTSQYSSGIGTVTKSGVHSFSPLLLLSQGDSPRWC